MTAARTATAAGASGELAAMVDELARLDGVFAGWPADQRTAIADYQRALEALHGEALRRLLRALQAEPVSAAGLRRAVADEVVHAVLRKLEVVKPSLDERLEAALARVRPMLVAHGGGVELVRIAPPRVDLRFLGECDGCSASAMTFHASVKHAVREACPELTDVRIAGDADATLPRPRLSERELRDDPPESNAQGRATRDTLPAPIAAALINPLSLAPRRDWHYACELSELVDGGISARSVSGRELLLARLGTTVTCFVDACGHLGQSLRDGSVDEGVLTCRHHEFQYDLATGVCLTAPDLALLAVPARVVGNRVDVRLEP